MLILQANLGRGKLATTEILSEGIKRKATALLLSEPYVGSIGQFQAPHPIKIVQSNSKPGPNKAVIAVLDQSATLIIDPQLQRANIAVAILKFNKIEIAIISVYLEKDKDIEVDLREIKKIKDKLATRQVIIGGDFNAWSTWWGSTKEDLRGDLLAAWFTEVEMYILNTGSTPTFEVYRQGRPHVSHVDITVCDASLLDKIDEWYVDREITSSDHNTILFKISLSLKTQTLPALKNTTRKYNTKRADWTKFHKVLEEELGKKSLTNDIISYMKDVEEIEEAVENYTTAVTAACDASIPCLKQPGAKLHPPWWTKELEMKKNDVTTKKRRIRCAAPRRRDFVIGGYQKAREEYVLAAQQAQTISWKEFCSKSEKGSVWEGAFRVLRRTVRPRPDVLLNNSEGELVQLKNL